MKDAVLFAGLPVAFATLVTVHVAIAYGLALKEPRWRAVAALFIPPLAPYWAFRGGMTVRGGVWVGSVALYTALLVLAML